MKKLHLDIMEKSSNHKVTQKRNERNRYRIIASIDILKEVKVDDGTQGFGLSLGR